MEELYLSNMEEISKNLNGFIEEDINKDSYCESKARYICEEISNFIDAKAENEGGGFLASMYISFINGYILEAIDEYDLYRLDCETNNREIIDKKDYIETEIELRLVNLKKIIKI